MRKIGMDMRARHHDDKDRISKDNVLRLALILNICKSNTKRLCKVWNLNHGPGSIAKSLFCPNFS